MAFGQQAGPPATARQLQELLQLLQRAGHADLRDARGPLGLTQRQAGGRFTRDEAEALLERLRAEAERPGAPGGGAAAPTPPAAPSAAELALRRVPAERLAAELQRRGWVVMEP